MGLVHRTVTIHAYLVCSYLSHFTVDVRLFEVPPVFCSASSCDVTRPPLPVTVLRRRQFARTADTARAFLRFVQGVRCGGARFSVVALKRGARGGGMRSGRGQAKGLAGISNFAPGYIKIKMEFSREILIGASYSRR